MLCKIKEFVEEFFFSFDMKWMSMVCQELDKNFLDVYIKGVEVVFMICDNVMDWISDLCGIFGDEEFMKFVVCQQEVMVKQGFRVLIIVYR